MALAVVACAFDSSRAQTAPASPPPVAATFMYIEPYQTRVEALFGAEMFLGWLGEKVDPAVALTTEAQTLVSKKAVEKADHWCGIKDNGEAAKGRLVSASFVKGEPGRTEPMKEGEAVAPKDSMIGIVWEFGTSPAPQTIEAQWWEWVAPVTSLPMKIFFGTHTENLEMTRALPFAKWQNDGRLPPPRPLAEVPMLPPETFLPIPVASLIWLVIGFAYYVLRNRTGRKPRGGWLGMIIAWVFVAAILSPMGVAHVRNPADKTASPVTTPNDAVRIANPLLRNIYRAFDYQTESQIYDSLARSVDGELLRKLYLDTMQALAIDGREGTRVKVSDVDVQIDNVTPGKDLTFTAEGQWTALGTVGHWGHTHTRVNRYNARVTIHPVGPEWKISGIEVLELRRL
jgi:hypothetical protein